MTVNSPAPQTSRSRFGWLLLILLLALFVGLNVVYESSAQTTTLRSGPPGALLYAAGFDGFSDEWQTYAGRLSAQIEDGVLRLRIDSDSSTAYSAALPSYADFDTSVRATAVDGPIDNAFGLLFRLTSDQDGCDMPLRLLCDLNAIPLLSIPLRLAFPPQAARQGYYLFLISSDGYYSLWRGGDAPRKISAWIASDAIRQGLGATNEIRVVGRGDRFQFFINGQAVALCIPDDPAAESTYFGGNCVQGQMRMEYVDDSFPQGQLALAAQSTQSGGAGVIVEFDHFIVTSPQVGDSTAGQRT